MYKNFCDQSSKNHYISFFPSPAPPQELARRGVPIELALPAIESVFGPEGLTMKRYIEEELAEAEGAGWVPAPAAEAELLAAARRQRELTAGLSPEARKRRLVGWLQRRGHPWETVGRVVRQLEEEEEAAAE
jgi:hypothetical protein